MKASFVLFVLSLACLCMQGCSSSYAKTGEGKGKNTPGGCLEISFRFQRGRIASSQYAIWIENEDGKLVRTVYATSFTVKGGYEYRKDALPVWVEKAHPQSMTSKQVDAMTGATPHTGVLTYTWDGTDDNGNRVPAGTYNFFVEGTLYWKSRVIYSGELVWGGAQQYSIPVKARHFSPSSVNENMITGLKACYIIK